jgi:hypothetical protein
VCGFPTLRSAILWQRQNWQELAKVKPDSTGAFARIARAQIEIKRPDLLFATTQEAVKKGWLTGEHFVFQMAIRYLYIETDMNRAGDMINLLAENYPDSRYGFWGMTAEWAHGGHHPNLARKMFQQAAEAYASGDAPVSASESLDCAALLARDGRTSAALDVLEDAEGRWGKNYIVEYIAGCIRRGEPVQIGLMPMAAREVLQNMQGTAFD